MPAPSDEPPAVMTPNTCSLPLDVDAAMRVSGDRPDRGEGEIEIESEREREVTDEARTW